MKIISLELGIERVVVAEMFRWMLAWPKDGTTDVYISDVDGEIETRNCGGAPVFKHSINNEFLKFCQKNNVSPKSTAMPWDDYTGEGLQNGLYEITVDEFKMFAKPYGFEVEAAPAAKVEAVPVTSPSGDGKPWLIANHNDPAPAYPWYTPARYFARQLVKDDSTLLVKKNKLAEKTAASLAGVGEFKRGKKKEPLSAGTVLKSFVNVTLN